MCENMSPQNPFEKPADTEIINLRTKEVPGHIEIG